MNDFWKNALWHQFGAAIDMLENAINACPEDLWSDQNRNPQYWYNVYHTLFWLDCYLSESIEIFRPPEPFTLSEFDPAGILPDRVYSKAEMLNYLNYDREKCRTVIAALTEESVQKIFKLHSSELSIAELMLDNMRHVQHHTAQLNLMLRQTIDAAPRWVTRTKNPLSA